MDNIVPSATVPAKRLPKTQCFSWCVHQSGHTEAINGDEQWCRPADVLEATTLYPSVEQPDGTFAPEVVRVQGSVNHQGLASRVHVGLGEAYGVEMTASEARRVAAAILAMADTMEAGR